MQISREQLLKRSSQTVSQFQFPDDYPDGFAGGKFFVRVLTAKEKSDFESQFVTKSGKAIRSRQAQMRERLVAITFCDESRHLLLSEEDVAALSEQDSRIVGFVAEAAATANKVEGDLEAIAKN